MLLLETSENKPLSIIVFFVSDASWIEFRKKCSFPILLKETRPLVLEKFVDWWRFACTANAQTWQMFYFVPDTLSQARADVKVSQYCTRTVKRKTLLIPADSLELPVFVKTCLLCVAKRCNASSQMLQRELENIISDPMHPKETFQTKAVCYHLFLQSSELVPTNSTSRQRRQKRRMLQVLEHKQWLLKGFQQ